MGFGSVTEELYEDLEPQERRPIANLFGNIQWTYVGQMENQEASLQIPTVQSANSVPAEFCDAYSALTMLTGQNRALRDNSINTLIVLGVCYFSPSWVILLLLLYYSFVLINCQRHYRKALALADQFYDRTIYRYSPEVACARPNFSDVVSRVIRIKKSGI